jgi:hypothetical protein
MKGALSIALLLAAASAQAQDYSLSQSMEAGYRWRSVGGDLGMYRSMVNYGNGPRLLSSSLEVHSPEGDGRLFDEIGLDTRGLGNDPYESAVLRVEKNRFYQYDLTWRSEAYYNPAATIGGGDHLIDTVRHVQDHDFTLFPRSNFKLFLGFSRDTQSGPALSTVQLFDPSGNAFPLFTDVNRKQNEKRLGGEIRVKRFHLNVLHGWSDYSEEAPASLTTASATVRREEPYNGSSPYWRVKLFREAKLWAANARFTYVEGRRAFQQDEAAALTPSISQQIIVSGDAQRPAATGNFTFSLFPASKATITNQTSVYNIRMVGNASYTQIANDGQPVVSFPFTYLGIRTVANSTDADLRLSRAFAIHAGYRYSSRRVRSVQNAAAAPEQTNALQTGTLGLRMRPAKPLTITLDAEIGRAGRPIYPISDRNYEAFRGRVEFKRNAFRLAGSARSDYNTNSASLANYASRSLQYGIDASWTASTRFAIDASYEKLHLDTLGAINYFVQFSPSGPVQQVSGDRSYYVSNLHTASLAARFSIGKANLSLGYSHVEDVGDGRATPSSEPKPYASLPDLAAAQTFPLRFFSPQARISVPVADKIRWNAGYQNYGYREDFSVLQNYRAHTGYTSLTFSF